MRCWHGSVSRFPRDRIPSRTFAYVLSRAELEEAVRASGVRRALPWDNGAAPRPLLDSLRGEYEVARLDEHFDFGLELLLSGLLGHAGGAR